MPDGNGLREEIGENRARIEGMERELTRVRDRQHVLAERVGIVIAYGERLDHLAREVHELTVQLGALARRAVERPTATTWQTLAVVTSTLVAVIAFFIALHH